MSDRPILFSAPMQHREGEDVSMSHPAEAPADFYTKTVQTLRQARDEGPTPLGQKMLRLGASMVDGHEFLALPEHCQEGLLELYGAAMFRVTGGLQ